MAPISFEPEIYTYNIDSGQHVSNIAYIQCMYAKGHRVPVQGNFASKPAGGAPPPPPPPR